MNKEGVENQLAELRNEATFHEVLNSVFGNPEGVKVLEYILALGNFGGIIKGDFDCGRNYVSSQVWADVLKASPEAAKKIIDMRYREVQADRQAQFKQAENQLKEVDYE